jgi:hypothetical protein
MDTQSDRGRLEVQWGHLALLVLIAGVVIAYLLDARRVSLRTNNLLMIQPMALIALGLVAAVVPQCFRRAAKARGESLGDLARIAMLAAAFGAFTLSMERVGFDLATFAFMLVALFVCGERRWWVLIGFSAVFTLLLVLGYGALIPFPFPLAVL